MRKRDRINVLYDGYLVQMWEFYPAGCKYFFRYEHGILLQRPLSNDPQVVLESRDQITKQETEFRDWLC